MSKILIDEATVKLVLEAMGLIGADLVCEAAHHEKADRHGIGEPCPIQARWHHAFATLREALVEQPAQQVVDSDEKAGAYMDARLWEFIDMAAAWPKASPDPRTWNHVVVYASKPAQQEPVALPEKTYEFVPTPEPAKWHHPECEGECIACLIERVVQEAYGSQGLGYLQRHLTSPPAQRTWVGLTDREIDNLYCEHHDEYGCQFSATGYERAIEAKLREKNA
ncbi:hypothetical protein UFOVP768_42 [uncultured Caudovirales phage]|uniref:Uncharacterized protein n=1 Tax=uncultured Caudovirales phage TaxID=2100421 RepID=A0A6J5LWF1_9CAUD|nr:hypothetical protein UFOVP320_20 [uncultured Caudovirales phage]CAB4161234.1 hypothetical protein UFOVP768_42 [uncultured Caudovirales phage]